MLANQKTVESWPNRAGSRYQVLGVVLVFMVGAALSVASFFFVRDWEQSRIQNEFELSTSTHLAAVQSHMTTHLAVIDSMAGLYAASDYVTASEFRDFVHDHLSRHPDIQGLSWNPRIKGSERGAFEERQRAEGLTGYQIKELDADGQVTAAALRAEYVPVEYIAPLAGNETARGFDIASQPDRLEALQRARDTGKTVFSKRLNLVQGVAGKYGYLVLRPVYRKDASVDTVAERREALAGFMVGVFRFQDWVTSALDQSPAMGIDVWLFDNAAPASEALLHFHSSRTRNAPYQQGLQDIEKAEAGLHRRAAINVPGRQWSVLFAPAPAFLSVHSHSDRQRWASLVVGLLITALLTAYLRFRIREGARLEESNAALAAKVVEHREAEQRAEEANQAKSQFLGRMSHEFRTPLNAILGFAQILNIDENKTLRPAEKDGIEQILKSGWHLLDVVSDLLDLAAIEANKLELHIEAVDLVERLQDSLDAIQPLADEREITLKRRVEACTGTFARADPVRLKQVLLNLLSNAVKYNHERGSVTVSCELADPDTVRISVTDTGPGILEEDMPTLFQPFSRLYLRTHATEGTGIGLTIAKQLVEQMGGLIGVTSELGRGSTFWIELTLSQPPSAQAVTAAKTPAAETTLADSIMLYIEDSPSHVQLVESIIESMPSIRLLSAHTPQLGLELATAHRPDIIVLDICLPGMDGFGVIERLGASEITREIPVIAVSANAMPLDIEKGLRAGFRRYLTKPINVAEFRKAVDELLRDSIV